MGLALFHGLILAWGVAAAGKPVQPKAAPWAGIYRNAESRQVMIIGANDDFISLKLFKRESLEDIFTHPPKSGDLNALMGAALDRPDHVAFHQRAEPDGCWHELYLIRGRIKSVSHLCQNPDNPDEKELVFTKLNVEQLRKIRDLPAEFRPKG